MYHFPNQQLYHHNHYQQCPISIEDTKLQNLNSISEAQYHQVLPQNIETNGQLQIENTIEQPLPHPEIVECVEKKKPASIKTKGQSGKGEGSKKIARKPAVDTSNFSIEERLVAAVWVHERKYTSSTISEIKHNFRRRFGRDPPSKTTLFAWERKLFSSGNVCDAPRTGRPVNRKSHISEVAASVRSAPTLSLRARALALRLPRSTLHNILRNDLPYTAINQKRQAADKQPPKRRVKQPPRKNQASPQQPPPVALPPPPAPAPAPVQHPPAPPHVQYMMHAMHAHTHGYT